MTQESKIRSKLSDAFEFTLTLGQLYELFPKFPKASVRRVLSKMKDNKKVKNIDPGSGRWQLIELWNKIRVTKTSEYTNLDKGNIEIDANMTGWISNQQVNLKARTLSSTVKTSTNIELKEQMMDTLQDEFDAPDEVVKIKTRGWEILDKDKDFISKNYKITWDWEMDITSSLGTISRTYEYAGTRKIDEETLY
jgi:hypothetical protein